LCIDCDASEAVQQVAEPDTDAAPTCRWRQRVGLRALWTRFKRAVGTIGTCEAARQAQSEVGLLAGMLSGDQPSGSRAESAQGGLAGLDLAADLVRQAQAAGLEVTYRLFNDNCD